MTNDLNVLVIGATGRVGRMLRRHWAAAPPRNLKMCFGGRSGGDVVWQAADGAAALAAHGPFDRLLVLAGVTPAPGAALAQNAVIARHCHAAAAMMEARHMLLASSQAVYGTALPHPCSEGDIPDPESAYGAAKLEAERSLAATPPSTAMRIGNVLGADALMLNAVRGPVVLDRFIGGGGPVRSYIGPATLAGVIETLLHAGPALPPALNVAAPMPVSMQALLNADGVRYSRRAAPPGATERITLDCSALAGWHGFAPGASDPARMIAEWHSLKDAP